MPCSCRSTFLSSACSKLPIDVTPADTWREVRDANGDADAALQGKVMDREIVRSLAYLERSKITLSDASNHHHPLPTTLTPQATGGEPAA